MRLEKQLLLLTNRVEVLEAKIADLEKAKPKPKSKPKPKQKAKT